MRAATPRRGLGVAVALIGWGVAASPAAWAAPLADVGVVGVGSDQAQFERQVELARAANVRWISTQLSWENAEPTPGADRRVGSSGERAIGALEARVRYARSRGMRVEVRLSNAPQWASGRASAANDPPLPEHVGSYARFLGDLAARVGPWVDAYSPWNEPNIPGFWDDPDPRAYVRLQQAAYRAIKDRDPSATVLAGPFVGVDDNAYDYVRAAYAAGLRGHADVVGWDGYPLSSPEDPYRSPNGQPGASSLAGLHHLGTILRRLDPGRRVWVMELGWSTCSASCSVLQRNVVTRAQQADYLERAVAYRRRYLSHLVDRIFWYSMRDTADEPAVWQHNSGLLTHDLRTKAAYRALVRLGRTGGAVAVGRPQWRAISPTRASAAAGGARVGVGPLAVVHRDAAITLTTALNAAGGRSVVRIEGFDGRRWSRLGSTALGRSARLRLTFTDRGYVRLRVRAMPRGDGRRVAVRTVEAVVPRR